MFAWRAIQDVLKPAAPSAPPVSTPRILPQLPPELLLRIIQLALPPALPDSGEEQSADRHRCLLSLCLVSRQFRDISRLELFHTIVLPRTARGFLKVLQRNPAGDLARLVKVMYVGRPRSKHYITWDRDVREAVELCINLEQLNLGSVRGIRLDEVTRCGNLTELSAINSSFASLQPVAEPSLRTAPPPSRIRHLDIGRCTLPSGSLPPASAFTNLRAVALWLTPREAQDSCAVVHELFSYVESHLSALTTSGSVQHLSEEPLRRLSSLELLDSWDFSPLDALTILTCPLRVLHINMTGQRSSSQPDRPPLALTTLQRLLTRPTIEPALASLEELHISFEKPPRIAPDYKGLADACGLRGVKLRYDLRPSLGAHFETEYWRAVRELEKRQRWS